MALKINKQTWAQLKNQSENMNMQQKGGNYTNKISNQAF
jgi:hypothetical protein